MSKKKLDTKKTLGIVVGVSAVGAGLYFLLKGKPKKVKPGAILGLRVVWENRGKGRFVPEFRCDLRGKPTWFEGVWLAVPALGAGETATFEIYSKPIPQDWIDKTIDIKLVAKAPGVGEGTVWSKMDAFKT